MQFIDEATIRVEAGKGGGGCLSFRREKYVARGGPDALRAVQTGAATVRAEGGLSTVQGRRAFRRLEKDMLARHVSPGGAADVLAAALFLDRLHAREHAGMAADLESAHQETDHGES